MEREQARRRNARQWRAHRLIANWIFAGLAGSMVLLGWLVSESWVPLWLGVGSSDLTLQPLKLHSFSW